MVYGKKSEEEVLTLLEWPLSEHSSDDLKKISSLLDEAEKKLKIKIMKQQVLNLVLCWRIHT